MSRWNPEKSWSAGEESPRDSRQILRRHWWQIWNSEGICIQIIIIRFREKSLWIPKNGWISGNTLRSDKHTFGIWDIQREKIVCCHFICPDSLIINIFSVFLVTTRCQIPELLSVEINLTLSSRNKLKTVEDAVWILFSIFSKLERLVWMMIMSFN